MQVTVYDMAGNNLDQDLIAEVERAVVEVIKPKVTVAQSISINTKVE
jgi:hypothetical protein